MTVVEGIEDRPGRGATSKTVPTPSPPGTPCCVEHQQVIGAPIEDLVGDRLLTAHGIQGHDAVFQVQRLELAFGLGLQSIVSPNAFWYRFLYLAVLTI